MKQMRESPITDKELQDAKSYLIGSVPLSLTSSDRISGMMIGLMADDLPINYLDERAEKIQSIQIDDILAVSKRLLTPEKLKIILVGNPEISDTYDAVLSLPNIE
jgi:zinc protease